MNACSVHVVPDRTKTYAAPTQMFAAPRGGESLSHPGGLMPGVRQSSSPAPAATVFPSSLIATTYTQLVGGFGSGSFDICLLLPCAIAAREQIDALGAPSGVVARTVDGSSGAPFVERAGHERVAVEAQRYRKPEHIAGLKVRALQVRLLPSTQRPSG